MASRTPRAKREDMPDPLAPPPTPAPQATIDEAVEVVDDEARKGLKTIGAQLIEFDKTEAGLVELETKYAKVVFPVETEDGLKDAKTAIKAIDTPRFALEHARKAAKAPVLELGRLIDGRAKEINTRLLALSQPIEAQVTKQETAEKARKDRIAARIEEIRQTPLQAVGKSSAQLEEILTGLDTLDLVTFMEFREEAARAQLAVMRQVRELRDQALQTEAAATQLREQKEKADALAAIRLRIATISDAAAQASTARSAATVLRILEHVKAIPIDDTYGELKVEAFGTRAMAIEQLQQLHAEKVKAETPAPTVAPTPAPTPAPTEAPMTDESFQATGGFPLPSETARAVAAVAAGYVDVASGAAAPAEWRSRRTGGFSFKGPGDADDFGVATVDANTAPRDTPAATVSDDAPDLGQGPHDGTVATIIGDMPPEPTSEDVLKAIVNGLADHFDDHPLNAIDYLEKVVVEGIDFTALRTQYGQPSLNLED